MKNNFDIKDNIIELLKEDLECVHQYLDDLKLSRKDEQGKEYSIVGRIKQLEVKHLRELSNIESFYLNKLWQKTSTILITEEFKLREKFLTDVERQYFRFSQNDYHYNNKGEVIRIDFKKEV